MRLLYDGRCAICRSLAFRLHHRSQGKLEILSLTSPEATALLDRFHPQGWAWDFYVVDGDACHRGLRALRALRKVVGLRAIVSGAGEYVRASAGAAQLAPSCAASVAPASRSRRAALRLATLAPVAYGLSKLPAAAAVSVETSSGLTVHTAEVVRTAGGFSVYVTECRDCAAPSVAHPRAREGRPARRMNKTQDDRTVADTMLADGGGARVRVTRSSFELWEDRAGSAPRLRAKPTVHVGSVEHARFDGTIGVADDGRVTMGGMIRHDLPSATVDYVVFPHGGFPPDMHVQAYAAGVRELAAVHARAGRTQLAASYGQIASTLAAFAASFRAAGAAPVVAFRSSLSLTSMPEMLSFAPLPARFREPVRPPAEPDSAAIVSGPFANSLSETMDEEAPGCGWSCSCGCGMCVACGCGLGFCLPPTICGCQVCTAACGCGCGYCCGASIGG